MGARQRAKHGARKGVQALAKFDKLLAQRAVGQEKEHLVDLATLQEALGSAFVGPRPSRMTGLGGCVPVQGYGETDSSEEWYFRFRHDEASLVVYSDDMFAPSYGAWCHDLCGDPYAGTLSHDEAMGVIISLWKRLAPGVGSAVDPAVVRAESGVRMYEEVEGEEV